VAPFTPGGGTDVVGRTLIMGMQSLLGQSLIIDNKPGAGTVIGTDIVAKALPDDYTLLLTTSAVAINDSLVDRRCDGERGPSFVHSRARVSCLHAAAS